MIKNRQEINFGFHMKAQLKEGYSVDRLASPEISDVNEDFLCAIC